jgi:acyl-CoA hydrolase
MKFEKEKNHLSDLLGGKKLNPVPNKQEEKKEEEQEEVKQIKIKKERKKEEKKEVKKEVKKEEVVQEKLKPGPKALMPMQAGSFNLPAALVAALDDYCNEHKVRKSEVVREALKAHFQGLGYNFDLDEGTFVK